MNKKEEKNSYENEKKTTRFTIRLNKKEHQEFIKKAKRKNLSIAEYLRYLVENDK